MAKRRTAFAPSPTEAAWSPEANPAFREILDHIAGQLAEEYVCLMKQAADEDAGPHQPGEEVGQ
jgi:hypothetical protein